MTEAKSSRTRTQADPSPRAPSSVAGPVPRHIAIIMDGNGRWAAKRGLPRAAGHREGAKAARRSVEAAIDHGVGWLTLFAFSSENWRRSQEEVSDLTFLLRQYLRAELRTLEDNNIRLHVIGERERFGPQVRAELEAAETRTAGNTRLNLVMALSYGARGEILAAARRIAREARDGTLDPETLDEAGFAARLSTAGMPDPDLVIRTSGEQRLSNFLLWQAAYAELVFEDALWPDFGAAHMARAIETFASRDRRFGARPEARPGRGGGR